MYSVNIVIIKYVLFNLGEEIVVICLIKVYLG